MRLSKYNKMVKRVVERRRRQEFGLWLGSQTTATQSSLATTLFLTLSHLRILFMYHLSSCPPPLSYLHVYFLPSLNTHFRPF